MHNSQTHHIPERFFYIKQIAVVQKAFIELFDGHDLDQSGFKLFKKTEYTVSAVKNVQA